MNYFEEEEQYMSEMTSQQMEDEYNRLAAMQAEIEAEIEEQKLKEDKDEQHIDKEGS